jgi:cation-transporting ATPase 13A3/4/5
LDEYFTFEYRLYRYYFDKQQGKFKPIKFSFNEKTTNDIHHEFGRGLGTKEDWQHFRDLYGVNSTAIPKTPLIEVFIEELLSPFFLFQVQFFHKQ